MSATINPDIVTDGLVLCLDAANPDCFRGEPTTNLITGSFVDSFGYSTVISSNEIDQYGVVRSLRKATINNISGWNRVVVSSSIGIPVLNRDYTISMWIKRVGDISVTAGWEPEVGPGDGYLRPNIESGYIGTAGASPQPNTVPTEWTYITYSFKYTATTTTNLLLLFYINGNVGAQILFSDPQVETKSYATPYVNGIRGGTVATGGGLFDLSNNNNHGTIVRNAFPTASFYNSANKGSLVFDGVNDYVSLDHTKMNAIFPLSSFSIELWIKTTNTTNYKGLFCIAYRLDMYYFANSFYVICNTSLGNMNAGNSNLVINDGAWHQIGFTASSSGYNWFKDGVIGHTVSSNFWNGSLSQPGVFSGIGRAANLGGHFPGSISFCRFYSKNLLASDIQQNYKALKGRYGL